MNSVRGSRAAVALVGVSLSAVAVTAACGDRRGFEVRSEMFEPDGSVDSGSAECLRQCSLDGRAVIEACTGEVVETCPTELACGAGVCREPCEAAAADRSSNGCEFYLQPPFIRDGRSCYAAFIVNTSTLPVEVQLEIEGSTLDVSKSMFRTTPGSYQLIRREGPIPAGESAVLFVSDVSPETPMTGRMIKCPEGVIAATVGDKLPASTGIGASYHLTTNAPVSLSAIYPFGGAASLIPSATLLLPVATWGTQNIIVNAWEDNLLSGWPGAQIVASDDDTEVTIFPTNKIQDGEGVAGTAAYAPATYRLDKGQVLQIVQSKELSGSIVTSTKPTSVFGGHQCMDVPTSRAYCDAALQQLPSFDQWGSEYVAVGYRPRLGDENELMPYRIVAARDDTRLDYDPKLPRGAPVTMSAGEVVTFYAGVGDAFVVRTQDVDHPVYLAAYMSGSDKGSPTDPIGNVDFLGRGDPEFVNVVAAGQYLNAYSFYADPTYDETSLVIVRAKSRGEFKDVWLDCAGNLTGFVPIGTRGEYEYTRVDLAREGGAGQSFGTSVCRTGLQRMKSDGPFTATLWGWAPFASYAMPSGMAQRKLVETPLAPIR